MADNLKYNEPGSGPLVATDDVASQHFQKFKLDVGGDGASIGVMGSVPVYIVSGTGSYLMNDPFVDSVAIGGQLDDTGTTTATENNVAPLRITAQRAAHVNLRNVSGTEIGTTTTNPIIVSGIVTQGAGSSLADNAWLMSGTLNIGQVTTDITIKFVRINATSDGDNTIISGVTNKKIRVLGYVLTVTTAGTITIQDTAGSPNIFGQFSLAAQGGASYAGGLMCPAFETLAGNGIEINVGAGQDCLGHMTYQEV